MSQELPNFDRVEYLAPQPAPPLDAEQTLADRAAYPRAILYGFGGAVLGSLIYGLIGHWVLIGYVAVLVGAMVGTAMMNGSGGIGGRRYQIAAVLLTYFAVTLAFVWDILWDVSRAGEPVAGYISHHAVLLVLLLVAGPFLMLMNHFVSAAIGLFILYLGLQSAWRIAKGGPGFVRLPGYNPHRPLDLR